MFSFQVLRYLGVSDGNMAEGSMRLDVNVSLRPKGETNLNTKVKHQCHIRVFCMRVRGAKAFRTEKFLPHMPAYETCDPSRVETFP